MNLPAHKCLIDKFIDWEKVEQRLYKYPNIGSQYNLKLFQECSSKPPFYCHYLALRLGTWEDDSLFEFLDNLFSVAKSLPNWESERHLLKSHEFGVFWGLLWQMQVANFFKKIEGMTIQWFEDKSGPDLRAKYKDNDLFIECYSFSKSFIVENFINDILCLLSPNIKVGHQLFLRFSLPNSGQKLDSFLDEIFTPYLDEKFIKKKEQEAQDKYPVLLPVPKEVKNFYIYFEGSNPDKYEPGLLPMGAGDENAYINQMVHESLRNKQKSNKLSEKHPNILAINFLIGVDLQIVFNHYISVKSFRIPSVYFKVFDCVVFEACGINQIPKMNVYFTPEMGAARVIEGIFEN